MTKEEFKKAVRAGIPAELPEARPYDNSVNHAPRRKKILTPDEERLALRNALRYFPEKFHAVLAPEFAKELRDYGRIYMYRFRPVYDMYARPIDEYPARSRQAAAIMMMIHNNLDKAVAQHPHARADYLRRQRRRVPELGAISAGHALSQRDDRRADSCHVLRPPAGAFPVAP